MDGASYYRERADHLRRLAEMTWQRDLEGVVRSLAQDYDETAEDLEAGQAAGEQRRDRTSGARAPAPKSELRARHQATATSASAATKAGSVLFGPLLRAWC